MNNLEISLRALEPEDLETLYKIENDRDIWAAGTTNVPYSRYVLHDYIANASNDIFVDKQVRLMIENAAGEAVGIVDLADFSIKHQRAELGIIIMKKYRRRGLAKATIKKILDYSRNVIHLNQIYAIVDSENQPSLKLFQSCGFNSKTELTDWLRVGNAYRSAILLQFFL